MSKQSISKSDLLALANQLLAEHEDFVEGAKATDVSEQAGVLVFKGEAFLDKDGLPTPQTPLAFNLYKWLCQQLSEKYQLQA